MVRSKISYQLIADGRTRCKTFKKRRTGFFKKLHELKTLCGVEVCAIVVNEDRTQSEVWPSPSATSEIVQKFVNLPSHSQTIKMVDRASFLRQNLSRLSKNLDRENMKVKSLERELLLARYLVNEEIDVSNSDELPEMLRLLKRKIAMVDRKVTEVEPSSTSSAAGKKREK